MVVLMIHFWTTHRRVWLIGVGLLLGFGLINLGLYAYFERRTYPNTQIAGQYLGSVPQELIESKLADLPLLPAKVNLSDQGKKIETTPVSLGIMVDKQVLAKKVMQRPSWLPMQNLVATHQLPLALGVDQGRLRQVVTAVQYQTLELPVEAKIILVNGRFDILESKPGHHVLIDAAVTAIVAGITQGLSDITLPVEIDLPKVNKIDLVDSLATLEAQQQTVISYKYGDKSRTVTSAQISGWYVPDGQTFRLSTAAISSTIADIGTGFGIMVQNKGQAVVSTQESLQTLKPLTFTLVAAPKARQTYTYCVANKQVEASDIDQLERTLLVVYGDNRGWGLSGQVGFSQVKGGCHFTVWLSAANQMTTFSTACDALWSCRVGSNVILNIDRWRYASDAWNKQGGSLEDYRAMVINHETGHWLGFGHWLCGGPGQLAPVMQQQSIDLQGCQFNPWPITGEVAQLRANLGL